MTLNQHQQLLLSSQPQTYTYTYTHGYSVDTWHTVWTPESHLKLLLEVYLKQDTHMINAWTGVCGKVLTARSWNTFYFKCYSISINLNGIKAAPILDGRFSTIRGQHKSPEACAHWVTPDHNSCLRIQTIGILGPVWHIFSLFSFKTKKQLTLFMSCSELFSLLTMIIWLFHKTQTSECLLYF